MFYSIYLLIFFARPLQTSFLSRVKNRYEYIPQEDIINVTEDLYDFDTTRQEKLVSYTIKSVSTTEPDPDDIVYLVPDVKGKEATIELNTSTTELDVSDIDVSYDYDVWPHTMPQWRPTLLNTESIDVTWKRRKTFPTYFPTRKTYSTGGTNATTKKSRSKPRIFPWILNKGSTKGNPLAIPSVRQRLTTSRYTAKANVRSVIKILKGKCYWCGLNKRGIPISPHCYAAFNSPDHRYRRFQRSYEKKCIIAKWRWIWGYNRPYPEKDEVWYSGFIGGCFKRFLDVGIVYTERGCRTYWGWKSGTYATNRFAHVERMLRGVDDGCVFSPHASLTPFSRAISLYARYHVCVCKKDFCNTASRHLAYTSLITLLLLIIFNICV